MDGDARSPTIGDAPAPLRSNARTAWTRHVFNTGFILKATYGGVSKLPKRLSYALGDAGTWLAARLMRETTDAVADNLRAVFPDATPDALRRIACETYRTYARDVVDFIRGLSLDDAAARALFTTSDAPGSQPPIAALLAERKGVILVSGHFGNWELGGVMMRAYGYPLTVLAMNDPSETVNEMRRHLRDRAGMEMLEVRQSMDTALQIRRLLGDNRVVAMLMDRHVDRDRVAVTFFGRRAYFLRTPPLIGYLTGAPLLPATIIRHEGHPFRLVTGEPIRVSREGNRDEAIARAAQTFATQLEALIRETPQCWYQFYRYWDAQAPVE